MTNLNDQIAGRCPCFALPADECKCEPENYFLDNAAYFLNNYVQATRGYSPYLEDEDPDLQKAASNPQVLRNCWEYEVERATETDNEANQDA